MEHDIRIVKMNRLQGYPRLVAHIKLFLNTFIGVIKGEGVERKLGILI